MLGFAYIDKNGIINLTKAGKEILNKKEKRDELMLRQLLKYQFPNFVNKTPRFKNMEIFLMEIVLKMLKELNYLNRYEAAISWQFCCKESDIKTAIKIVKNYRKEVEKEGKKDPKTMLSVFDKISKTAYPNVNLNKKSSHLTAMDAIFRFLEYTSLFIQSGLGDYTKISIREMAREKVELLIDEYDFEFNPDWKSEDFFKKFGDPYCCPLPWDRKNELFNITWNNLQGIREKINNYEIPEDNKFLEFTECLLKKLNENRDRKENLRKIGDKVRELSTSVNEIIFIHYKSKTLDARKMILEKFRDIIDGKTVEESLAIWLENNTWRSLVALDGDHHAKRNFSIEPDLSPRFFAPGVGNTPDIELYNEDFIIIIEVTLTTGVAQWKSEAGAVVDHINSFIEVKMGEEEERKGNVVSGDPRKIIGLFLARTINSRIMWLFFALNKHSWLNQPIPIIPINLEDYIKIIEKLYSDNIRATYFEKFLYTLHREAMACSTVAEWEKSMNKKIRKFIEDPQTYIRFNF